jgi:hypothetical protein
MVLHGRIEDGAIVLPGGIALPNGTEVTVIVQTVEPNVALGSGTSHVQLPLVKSKHPGSRSLTPDRVAEVLEEDDLSA